MTRRKHTLENVRKEIQKYKTINQLILSDPSMYSAILKHPEWKKEVEKRLVKGMNYSAGEESVRCFFEEIFGLPFKRVRPDWLLNPETNRVMELDGYNSQLKIAFEYQGIHHFSDFYRGRETKGVRRRDIIKRKICNQHKIKLFVIRDLFIDQKSFDGEEIKKRIKQEFLRLRVPIPQSFQKTIIKLHPGRGKWTVESVRKIAKKHKNVNDFMNKDYSAYNASYRLGIFKEVTSHMRRQWEADEWTKETALRKSKEFSSRLELQAKKHSLYKWLKKNNLYLEACSHMKVLRVRWSKDKAFSLAKQFKTRSGLRKKWGGCVLWLEKNRLLDEACKHMVKTIQWDKESAFLEAKKYKSLKELRKKRRGALSWLKKNSLLDEACIHMKRRNIRNWDKKTAILEAKKFQKISHFHKSSKGAYHWLERNNLLAQACSHMVRRG